MVKKLNLISQKEMILKRMETDSSYCPSVTDKNGKKVIPPDDDPYPYLDENVFAVHNPMLYKIFTLEIVKDDIHPDDFIQDYGIGFLEGLHFLENERIILDNYFDENKKMALIESLKRLLHQRKFKNNMSLLKLAFDCTPLVWTTETIKEAGKYSGMVTAIDLFADRAGLAENDLGKETAMVEDFKEKENSQSKNKIDPKTYTTHWFRSGLKFANGTMDKYWNNRQDGIKEPYSAPDIAKAVGLLNTEKYILGVFKNYKTDKNLFNDPHKIKILLDYCETRNIKVSETFLKKQAEKMNEYK